AAPDIQRPTVTTATNRIISVNNPDKETGLLKITPDVTPRSPLPTTSSTRLITVTSAVATPPIISTSDDPAKKVVVAEPPAIWRALQSVPQPAAPQAGQPYTSTGTMSLIPANVETRVAAVTPPVISTTQEAPQEVIPVSAPAATLGQASPVTHAA